MSGDPDEGRAELAEWDALLDAVVALLRTVVIGTVLAFGMLAWRSFS